MFDLDKFVIMLIVARFTTSIRLKAFGSSKFHHGARIHFVVFDPKALKRARSWAADAGEQVFEEKDEQTGKDAIASVKRSIRAKFD